MYMLLNVVPKVLDIKCLNNSVSGQIVIYTIAKLKAWYYQSQRDVYERRVADNKLIFIHCVRELLCVLAHRYGSYGDERTIRISIEYLRERLPPTVRYI